MITNQREKFAQLIADGKSQADAYRSAYPKSVKWTPAAVYQEASKLISIPEVSQRVEEIRASLVAKALWTREDSVNALLSVVNDGEVRHNDKTAAVKVLNEMHGFNAPTKVDASVTVKIIE